MRYYRETLDFRVEDECVITLGKFDGLHRGHELLMEELRRRRASGLAAVVFTFDIPPRAALIADSSPLVLTTSREKRGLFEKAGVDVLIECPFVEAVRSMEPERFIRWIVGALHVRCIVAGRDFHFGYRRAGDYQSLMQYADRYGYEAVIYDKLEENGREISSSCIRRELLAGRIEAANRLLGYAYFVESPIVHGKALGRTIGIPTINMLPPKEKLLPPNGVYVTRVTADGRELLGVTNVGTKPTIEGVHPVGVETHLPDFCGDLYGQELKVEFLSYLRPEKKFPSVDALRQQMDEDIKSARSYSERHIRKERCPAAPNPVI